MLLVLCRSRLAAGGWAEQELSVGAEGQTLSGVQGVLWGTGSASCALAPGHVLVLNE